MDDEFEFRWTTFDGRRLRVTEIEDDHLINIARMLMHRRVLRGLPVDGLVGHPIYHEFFYRGLNPDFLTVPEKPHLSKYGTWQVWSIKRNCMRPVWKIEKWYRDWRWKRIPKHV